MTQVHRQSSEPQVLMLCDTSRSYGRNVLRGVWKYVEEHRSWSILFRPNSFEQPPPTWIHSWDGDGVMSLIGDRSMARVLKKLSVACVDLLGDLDRTGIPFVGTDHVAIGHMAVAHLRDCGLTSFATCGLPRGSRPGLDVRCDTFRDLLLAEGLPCEEFDSPATDVDRVSWDQDLLLLADWIRGLPKPVGIFCCNDTRGREVLDACRLASIAVPHDVAVLGVGREELISHLSRERLSSIDVNPQLIGYQAARTLEELMAGKEVPMVQSYPPRRVVRRQSTDVLAVGDPDVSMALRYIRDCACQGISVKDVVGQSTLERRVLERRFRQLVGRSPNEEIMRVRLERAKQLLVETDLSCAVISEKCGFGSSPYFMDLFRRKVGVTPGAFRRFVPVSELR